MKTHFANYHCDVVFFAARMVSARSAGINRKRAIIVFLVASELGRSSNAGRRLLHLGIYLSCNVFLETVNDVLVE